VPVKQSWEVGTVLAPYKPFSIRSRGSRIPRSTSQSLVRITPKNGGELYVSSHKFERIPPPTRVGGDPAAFVLKRRADDWHIPLSVPLPFAQSFSHLTSKITKTANFGGRPGLRLRRSSPRFRPFVLPGRI